MILSSLSLHNFRSYEKQSFVFSAQTTIVIGPNASGKTNLLEAIYLLATGKSFRAKVEREMIGYEKEMSNVKCCVFAAPSPKLSSLGDKATRGKQMLNDKGEEVNLEIVLTRGEVMGQKAPYKKYLVNNVAKRMVDFVGNLKAVVFWPQDLELITGSPSGRRKYLDSVLSQVDWEYRRTLVSYEKGLRSRNRLLEQIQAEKADRRELFFWDQLLIKHGGYLSDKRAEFIQFINQQQLTIDDQLIEVIYDKSVICQDRLNKYQQEEVAAATTLVGPHRDDFEVMVRGSKENKEEREESGRDLHTFGSRGEQRLSVLWLKLAELAYIEKITEDRPILLLDDILSELDHEHRQLVFETIPKQQTIITTTDRHYVEGFLEWVKVISLSPYS